MAINVLASSVPMPFEANRRIEFTLIVPESTEEPTALEQIEAEAAAAAQQEATE